MGTWKCAATLSASWWAGWRMVIRPISGWPPNSIRLNLTTVVNTPSVKGQARSGTSSTTSKRSAMRASSPCSASETRMKGLMSGGIHSSERVASRSVALVVMKVSTSERYSKAKVSPSTSGKCCGLPMRRVSATQWCMTRCMVRRSMVAVSGCSKPVSMPSRRKMASMSMPHRRAARTQFVTVTKGMRCWRSGVAGLRLTAPRLRKTAGSAAPRRPCRPGARRGRGASPRSRTAAGRRPGACPTGPRCGFRVSGCRR